MDNAALQAKLAAILDAFPAKSALHAVDLTTGEVIASLRAETRVVSASTIKVALLFCALEDVMAGKLALDAHIPSPRRTSARTRACSSRSTGRTAVLCGRCSTG